MRAARLPALTRYSRVRRSIACNSRRFTIDSARLMGGVAAGRKYQPKT